VTDDRPRGHPSSDGQMLQVASQMPLLESARADPAAQVELIFRAHADFVWRALRRQGVPEADIEDAVQEVFMVVYRKVGDYVEQGAIRAWLFTISRQVANHHRRSYARRERKQQALLDSPVAGPDRMEGPQRAEAVSVVNDFLAELGDDQAMVFYLVEIEGLTAPEVATSLDVNLNTVYGRLRLARKRFEDMLAERAKQEL
jgi:RNA polymerase sigma-70 factor, ECF subfamily